VTLGHLDNLPDRPRLGTEVAAIIRNALLTGEYPAGERLRIEDLAKKLKVSTMPVREALVMLANEGLLEALPRRGFKVTPISRQEIQDVFLVHALIAGELAQRAAAMITNSDLAALKEIQEQIERAGAEIRDSDSPPPDDLLQQVEQLNYEFHATISRASDSARLRWFLRATTRYVPPGFFQIPGWVDSSVEGHPALIQALVARDGELAKQLTIEHFMRGGELVSAAYGDRVAPPGSQRPQNGPGAPASSPLSLGRAAGEVSSGRRVGQGGPEYRRG
jgi:DNA-binding GntR family transcriptional regulator